MAFDPTGSEFNPRAKRKPRAVRQPWDVPKGSSGFGDGRPVPKGVRVRPVHDSGFGKGAPRVPKPKKVAPIHVTGAKPPAAIPHGRATGFVPPPAPPSYLQQAQQAVNPVYAPQYAGVDAQVALDHSQAAQQAATQHAWAQQQAAALAHISPDIMKIYGQAASNDAVFGKGYSDGLQQAQNANSGDINKILAQNGAPAGQMQNPGSDAADVLYGLGGQIPASTLNAQGAAFASAAAFLPATALGRGQLASQDAFQQGNLQAQKDALHRYEIDANKANAVLGRSDQLQSADVQSKQQARDLAVKQQAAQFQERLAIAQYGTAKDKADFDRWYKTQYLNQRDATITANNQKTRANLTLAERRINNQYASIYGVDPVTGRPTLAAIRASKSNKVAQKKTSTLTANGRVKLRGTAATIAQNAYGGFVSQDNTPAFPVASAPPPDGSGWTEAVQVGTSVVYRNHHPEIGYQQAVTEGLKEGIPLAMMLPALDRYYKRGERGRPMKSIYQRRAAAKKKP